MILEIKLKRCKKINASGLLKLVDGLAEIDTLKKVTFSCYQ